MDSRPDNRFSWFVRLTGPLRLKVMLTLVFVIGLAGLGGDLLGQDNGDPAPKAPSRKGKAAQDVVTNAEDAEKIEDPITLLAAGKYYLAKGDKALAKIAFEAGIKRLEINNYSNFAGTPLAEAVLAEYMGDFEASRKIWREQMKTDVLQAYFFIEKFSQDPTRNDLLAEAKRSVESAIEKVKAGESPTIYITKKGSERKLKMMTNEEVVEAVKEGKKLRYAYIEELDLSQQTLESGFFCNRCVVGSIKAYGSTFGGRFAFRGFVMGDAHFGKKWKGEVNKSGSIPASTFDEFFFERSVVFGSVILDSVKIQGRLVNMPLTTIAKDLDARNMSIANVAEFRYSSAHGIVNFKGAEFNGPSYFGYTDIGELDFSRVVVRKNVLYFNQAHFHGPVEIEKCEFVRGATFENATFDGPAVFRQSRVYARLNLSRAEFAKDLTFSQIELTDLDFFGTHVKGKANFGDSIFQGNARFALDGLTRRLHLQNVDPLHKLYKLYQGDDDAEEDLTVSSQYGVTHVDDLTATFDGEVSFANSIFQKFVNFEGVQFGTPESPSLASFYNTQFYGEAHFERTNFYSVADFRTIFGNEVAFNQAQFHQTWMLDDANIPGRLSMSGAALTGSTTVSFYGARVSGFGVSFDQLKTAKGDHRLFYEQCFNANKEVEPYVDDVRLLDARWDSINEVEITDPEVVTDNIQKICASRAIAEFVVLRDSFNKRGMIEENDWAYWHLRHYKNRRSRIQAPTVFHTTYYWGEWLVFEKGFGWGVRLANLLGTGLVVILFFMMLLRILCAEMVVDWDGKPTRYKDLPIWAMFVVSFHSFLGRARDWKSTNSPAAWKLLYTAEIIFGIILITFFIGAYTRMVLR